MVTAPVDDNPVTNGQPGDGQPGDRRAVTHVKTTTKRSTKKVDRRDVHPNPLRAIGGIVPSSPPGFPHRIPGTKNTPSRKAALPCSVSHSLRYFLHVPRFHPNKCNQDQCTARTSLFEAAASENLTSGCPPAISDTTYFPTAGPCLKP